ncbi:hypothetical protein CFE53_04740 [Methanofervidicoccus sp. A16]|uniref:hypothetical protein n=1 Tax=Methanofervidicoccus sp. A16 TaxID=2607662 RepID=UPI00118A8CCC|nr:hypothetical protein [Methanofervidicoccus sp. A16]AXI25474.1 hypothetical protein CFE53_04740 [Methanofervidicoccus sp. A16]
MFWDDLDKIKNYDFFQEIENRSNIKLIKYFLKYIFQGDESYQELLRGLFKNREEEKEKKNSLIEYLTLIIVANTRYYNLYIKNYIERYKKKYLKEVLKDNNKLNKVSVWEFIKVSAHSRNNDLKLERLDVKNGLVNIDPIRETYYIEKMRIKLREMIEKIRANKDVNLLENESVREIVRFMEGMVKFKDIGGGIRSVKFKGEIPLEWHPPCIRKILEDILSGGSPSHYARRSFVVYWFCAKFDPNLRPLNRDGELVNVSALDIAKSEEAIENFLEEMLRIFGNVEDFNPEKTRYYISHNIGYRVADHLTHCEYCKNWREDGGKGLSYYCNPDEICRMRKNGKPVVIHPLDYLCYNINRHVKSNKKREKD